MSDVVAGMIAAMSSRKSERCCGLGRDQPVQDLSVLGAHDVRLESRRHLTVRHNEVEQDRFLGLIADAEEIRADIHALAIQPMAGRAKLRENGVPAACDAVQLERLFHGREHLHAVAVNCDEDLPSLRSYGFVRMLEQAFSGRGGKTRRRRAAALDLIDERNREFRPRQKRPAKSLANRSRAGQPTRGRKGGQGRVAIGSRQRTNRGDLQSPRRLGGHEFD